ncbi:GDP-mannose 3,5-epimerase 1-like [Hibiscus syriacus]|uniref:GDP-mannose 3,5-epimerase 1-like n=1 Tax=Hibiscus syriacus TaxID=106335 RepID=A0A6A2YEN3_HIBSY|nr:probable BOI-related E3 ubiquitin-protein ligase 3 [Hibiscus syriacus]KAE8672877.1 GDP-mannose 3,5-epimerase 1-like [Hibiscus syriacus]
MAIQAQLYSDNIGFPLCCSLDGNGHGNGNGNGGFNQFCFGNQQLQQQHQLQIQQPGNQSFCFEENDESIDQFIKSQNERLRLLLQEQRKQQVLLMAEKLESKATPLFSQKEAELARAANRTMELQNLLNKLETENQAWRRVAQENEAIVVSLNNTLEQLQQQQDQAGCRFDGDAESCCGGTEEENNNRGLVETKKKASMVCKCCNSRSSCVLFLPCRHLCSCKDCEAFLDCCPLCRTAKKATIEALIS